MQKKVEIFTLALLLIFAFYCALSVGISWDFEPEVNRGNERLKYILFPSMNSRTIIFLAPSSLEK